MKMQSIAKAKTEHTELIVLYEDIVMRVVRTQQHLIKITY